MSNLSAKNDNKSRINSCLLYMFLWSFRFCIFILTFLFFIYLGLVYFIFKVLIYVSKLRIQMVWYLMISKRGTYILLTSLTWILCRIIFWQNYILASILKLMLRHQSIECILVLCSWFSFTCNLLWNTIPDWWYGLFFGVTNTQETSNWQWNINKGNTFYLWINQVRGFFFFSVIITWNKKMSLYILIN